MPRRTRKTDPRGAFVQEMEWRKTSLSSSPVLYIRIRREDCRPMSWPEVWAVFADRYPGRWACQFFPPASQLVDEANIYHLFVFEEGDDPVSVNIRH